MELILNNLKIKLVNIGLAKQVYYLNLLLHYITISARDPNYDPTTLTKRLTWVNEVTHALSGMIIFILGKEHQVLDITIIDEIHDKSIYYECQNEFNFAIKKVNGFIDNQNL